MWRETLESKGFRLSRTKTEYIRCDFDTTTHEEGDVNLEGQIVPKKDTFRYLRSVQCLSNDQDYSKCIVVDPLPLRCAQHVVDTNRFRSGEVGWR